MYLWLSPKQREQNGNISFISKLTFILFEVEGKFLKDSTEIVENVKRSYKNIYNIHIEIRQPV